ncbi:hypothetical protein VUR80DRAFT_4523 [Thermomyces stellatus]
MPPWWSPSPTQTGGEPPDETGGELPSDSSTEHEPPVTSSRTATGPISLPGTTVCRGIACLSEFPTLPPGVTIPTPRAQPDIPRPSTTELQPSPLVAPPGAPTITECEGPPCEEEEGRNTRTLKTRTRTRSGTQTWDPSPAPPPRPTFSTSPPPETAFTPGMSYTICRGTSCLDSIEHETTLMSPEESSTECIPEPKGDLKPEPEAPEESFDPGTPTLDQDTSQTPEETTLSLESESTAPPETSITTTNSQEEGPSEATTRTFRTRTRTRTQTFNPNPSQLSEEPAPPRASEPILPSETIETSKQPVESPPETRAQDPGLPSQTTDIPPPENQQPLEPGTQQPQPTLTFCEGGTCPTTLTTIAGGTPGVTYTACHGTSCWNDPGLFDSTGDLEESRTNSDSPTGNDIPSTGSGSQQVPAESEGSPTESENPQPSEPGLEEVPRPSDQLGRFEPPRIEPEFPPEKTRLG